ncbi:VWA domain-containing protein [Luteimonas qiangzhengi]|uniref:VWA domain-containing protein n=1 Tax=Luteimonas sp. MJ146 TaxID=3129240 RepID=UPI0031BB627C
MIQTLAEVQFMRPHWLWLLLALPLLALWWVRRRSREDAWHRRVDPHLLPHLLAPGSGRRRVAGAVLGVSTFGLAVLALAGPGWRVQPQQLWQEASPLVIALDLSSATGAADLQPSRLLQARAVIDSLLEARTGGQVALVAFAGSAHTVAPLTGDVDNVAIFLDALAPDIMPTDGSDPARAIAWSAGLLAQAGLERGDILVLTHDADAGARRAAAAAARTGYTVSVLGLGTGEGAMHRDARGRVVHSHMAAGALQALADAGAGRFVALAGADGAQEFANLGNGARVDRADSGAGAGIRADQGYWLLLPLMLLAALAFRRGGGLLLLVLMLGLPLGLVPAHAQVRAQTQAPAPEAGTREGAPEGDLWRRADQIGHARGLAAVEAYRRGEYEAAARIWAELPGVDDAYNRGNALARAGHLEPALEAYDEALARQPDLEDAVANRRVVEEALQKRSPPSGDQGNEQGDDTDPQNADGQQPPQPSRQPGSEGQQGGAQDQDTDQDPGQEQDGQQSSHGQDSQTQEDGDADLQPDSARPDPADTDAQQTADEALREQMQQTLEGGESSDEDPQDARQALDDIHEQERREADEAWLRRIPDDPGGLLRARFRLEHERRVREGAD